MYARVFVCVCMHVYVNSVTVSTEGRSSVRVNNWLYALSVDKGKRFLNTKWK